MLITRNVVIKGNRTSLRLEPPMWDALGEISERENITVHELCTLIDEKRGELARTSAIRVFIMSYFRAAATDEGHLLAGHGEKIDRRRVSLRQNMNVYFG